jgi:hypothetical protein
MTWINAESIANKVNKILGDNAPTPSEWKYAIPTFIVQAPMPVVINAKNLADGINEAIEKYHPDFKDEWLAFDAKSDKYQME